MMVIMERAERLVHLHLESKPLRDPLYGEVAKPLKFKLVHRLLFSFQILFRLRIESRLVRVFNESPGTPYA